MIDIWKTRTYVDNVYTNFCGLNVSEDDIECKCFTAISINSLPAYENKYYPQVYLDKYIYLWNCKQTNERLSWWQNFNDILVTR